jgi:excinuclease ABC subunit C
MQKGNEDGGKRGDRRGERFFLPGRSEPIELPPDSGGLHLLLRVRDEAHRFALGYHRKLRKLKSFKSGLDEIPGIGPKRKKLLLRHFGSLKKIREATMADLTAVPGIGAGHGEAIYRFFHD